LRKLLREPLLHFLLLGATIFAAYSLISKPADREPGKIVVTRGQLESLAVSFALTSQRRPTREEWEGLIRDRVREEVYYREAIALGLDKDDTIIRRRLAQKMEFVANDVAAARTPTDAELNAYLLAHPDKFREKQRFTFTQVYLDPKKYGEKLARHAAELESQLNQNPAADVSRVGDALMLDSKFDALPADEIAKLFGEKFATSLADLPPGHWQGPIESAYGAHLVLVSNRGEPRMPALIEVRDAVEREWTNAKRLEANEKAYGELLKHYIVSVEPADIREPKNLAAAK
jgi:hypothetical protein